MKPSRLAGNCLTLIIAVLLLTACEESKGSTPSEPASPPTTVGVVEVKAEPLPIVNELPGRIAPTRLAEVRPRVSGIVVERVFEQGSQVNEGDVLYRIDPAPFQVQVDSAKATLAHAKAAQLQARQNADRQERLRQSNVSSVQNLESAVAVLAQADADVAAAEAGLKEALLNLQYANVTAPISGRIGRALITEGALVSANSSEKLATIQQLDPIYADFTQPAADLIRLKRALQDGQLMIGNDEAKVQLVLDDGTLYPLSGRLLFSEAAVDETTGQVTLRGEFPNPNGDLLPGMYVRVEIVQGIEKAAIAVPQQAVQRDAGGQSSVLVVDAGNELRLQPVVVGRTVGDRYVVTRGLKGGEKVVAEGFQKVAPGGKVNPQKWEAKAASISGETAAQHEKQAVDASR